MIFRTDERLHKRLAIGLVCSFIIVLSTMTTIAQESTPIAYVPPASLSDLSGTIVADGSATVAPVTEAVAEEFVALAPNVQIEVSVSGTGGGFDRFCKGETIIQNASRAIHDSEAARCAQASVEFYAFRVAYDGVAVVVNPKNDFVSCLTVDQLYQMWRPDDPATNWNQIDSSFPDQRIRLYGPGTSSGTFDYFTKEIVGEEGTSNVDYLPSEDHNQLVEGVAGDTDALGYFGLAYYEQNQERLKLVAIDDGHGCVAPTAETVRTLRYAPLSRPLFIYVNAKSLERSEVQAFVEFYLASAADLVADVGYIASPDEVYAQDMTRLLAAIDGTGIPDSVSTPVAGVKIGKNAFAGLVPGVHEIYWRR